jgi:splicing factor 3B subunit 1
VMRQVAKKMEEEKEEKKRAGKGGAADAAGPERKKRRWDSAPGTGGTSASAASTAALGSATPMLGGTTPMMGGETPMRMDGGATPLVGSSAWDAPDTIGGTTGGATPSRWDAPTPSIGQSRRNRWDETPMAGETPRVLDPGATPSAGVGATPVVGEKKVRSRWDETPVVGQTPSGMGATPIGVGISAPTPMGGAGMETPMTGQIPMTPEMMNEMRYQKDVDERNRPWTDEELDALFPPEGYEILQPPSSYKPLETPSRKLLATPTPGGTPGYAMPQDKPKEAYSVPQVCQR